jgi:hypothetical protein
MKKLNQFKDSQGISKKTSNHWYYISKQPMELINEYTGEMKCKVCGSIHLASIKPRSNGRYYRGAWQCQFGCKTS